MKPNKGLRRDESLNNALDGSWRYALNLSLSFGSRELINEDGTTYKTYLSNINTSQCIGVIPINNILISFHVDNDSCSIWKYQNGISTKIVSHPDFNFSIYNPIIGVAGYNNSGELIIIWTDATQEYPKVEPNVPRYLNIDNLPFEIDDNKVLVDPQDIDLLNLFPTFSYPQIQYTRNKFTGGNLKSGVYYYFICYEISDGFFGEWMGASQPVIVHPSSKSEVWEEVEGSKPGQFTAKSVELSIGNLDTRYPRYKLAYLSKIDGVIDQKVIATNATSTSVVVHTGNEQYEDISLETLFTENMVYHRVKSMAILNNILYIGNVQTAPIIRYQKYANNIWLKWIAKDRIGLDNYNDSFKNPYLVFTKKTFMPGDIYAFYLRFILKNGKKTQWFHIPGRRPIASELEDSTNANALDIYSDAKKFHLENTASIDGTFGYWENASEVYPNDDEFNGLIDYDGNHLDGFDLRGQKVRHHKFPTLKFLKDNNIDFVEHNTSQDNEIGTVIFPNAKTDSQNYIGSEEKHEGNVKVLKFNVVDNPTDCFTVISDTFIEPDGESKRYNTVLEATRKVRVDCNVNINCDFERPDFPGNMSMKATIELLHRVGETEIPKLSSIQDETESQIHISLDDVSNDIDLEVGDKLILRASCWTVTHENNNPVPKPGFTGFAKIVVSEVDSVSTEKAILLGVTIDEDTFEVPDYIREQASYCELGYAKRTNANASVLGQAMITTVAVDDDGNKYCREHSFDLISTLAALNITHADRQLSYNYANTQTPGNTIIFNTDDGEPDYVIESSYKAEPLCRIEESKYMQRDNAYIFPSNEKGEDYIYHRGQFDDDGTPAVDDADETNHIYTLANFCSFKPNVYNSFYNQQIVSTGSIMTLDGIGRYNIYGGDCHVNLYGVTRYWNDPDDLDPDDNPINKFWYFLYPCYSVANIGLQHHGEEIDEIYFPYFNLIDNTIGRGTHHKGTGKDFLQFSEETGEPEFLEDSRSLWKKLWELGAGTIKNPCDLDQWIGYNFDYSSVNDIKGFAPIFDPSIEDLYKFPHRVAAALLNAGGHFIGCRLFPVASYIEMPKDKGPVWNIISDNNDLLVSLKYGLYAFRQKSELNIEEDVVVSLGSSNLFENKPDEILYTKDGTIGNQCQFANPTSIHGILFIDKERGKIFLYKDGRARELSNLGMTNFFNTNLKYDSIDANPIDVDYLEEFNCDNPYVDKGIQAIYDARRERFIIKKRANTSFVISYSPNLNYIQDIGYLGGWLSFHSYNPLIITAIDGILHSIKSGTVYIDDVEVLTNLIYEHTGNKCQFYNTYYDSKLDLTVVGTPNQNKLFDSIQWATTVKDTSNNPLETTTLSKIVVFTNTKHSDLITLINSTFGSGNIRKTGGEWKFSQFRDCLSDKSESLIDDLSVDELLYETMPVEAKNTLWYNNSYFKCEYLVVRLIFTNSTNKSLVIHDVSINATPRKRF